MKMEMKMEKETKIFSEWEEVDCNECSHYWDSSCDGARIGSKAPRRLCTTFLATRNVLIPLQIKKLQRDVKWVSWASILIGVSQIILCAIFILLKVGVL